MSADLEPRRSTWREDPRILLGLIVILLGAILAVEIAAVLS